ncbi:hypothetical protein ACFRIB_50280 [Streptomyces mirabilis]|uniref:hypothetical protein n=1 Tax=Streptomyces mirabilis TaxID=68239 RepID=UPI003691EDB5
MNPIQHQDGERHEALSPNPTEKADRFAAIMKRLKGRSEQERAQLRSQVDGAILGHEAYALGHENLRRGNYVAANRWLRVAADHSVPGAEQALDEIEVSPTGAATSPMTVEVTTADSDPCTAAMSRPVHHDFEKWASVLHNWIEAGLMTSAARAEAQEITAQAHRAADEFLAKARQELQTVEDARVEAERRIAAQYRASAELLREAERLQQEARLILQKVRWADEVHSGESTLVLGGGAWQRPRPIAIDGDGGIDSLRSRQRPRAALMEATAERALQETFEETSAEAWQAVMRALIEACSRAQASMAEGSVVESRGVTTWLWRFSVPTTRSGLVPLRQTSCFSIALVPFREDQLSPGDAGFELAQWLGRCTTAETASSAGSQSVMRCFAAGNEVVLTTPTVEQQDSGPHLTVWTITDCEVEGESDSTSGVLSIEEAAHAAPR